ncbi:dsrm domain-containing protein [Cephalotus follicularis]|uniref:Dsrm domain-containing protein n=1 Tax=Cephalotus follicularis TaxID=3775 RepID=A0A1Q3BWM3_CEPFO|nr:dsrm domain-containing protein [Cephalotus follicularis]
MDPSITNQHETPTTLKVHAVAKQSPVKETSLVTIPKAHFSYIGESKRLKIMEEEEEELFCSTKCIDPSSANIISKEVEKKGSPSAKSQLFAVCAEKKWKSPMFECCKEEGPGHMKLFTFKVVVEIEDASNAVLECFGAPQSNKKTAAEHAAEGALWFIKHQYFKMTKSH